MAQAELLVRVWCLRCARGREFVAAVIPAPFAALPLVAIAAKMRCRSCRCTDAIIIFPGSPPRTLEELPPRPGYDGAAFVVHFFHTMRALRKRPPKATPKLDAALKARAEREAMRDAVSIGGRFVQSRKIEL